MESILIVDDDVNICDLLSEELTEAGYETSCLSDSEKVLDFLREKVTDIVLLDLNMPGKNGFQIQKEINDYPGIKPKVIILTAHSDVKSALNSAMLGAADFICKPYDFGRLLASIRKIVKK